MGVSVTGMNQTFGMVRRLAVAVVVLFCVLGYLYGPPAFPATRDAAIEKCNAYAEGNYRSFRLSWQVGVRPHWTCTDASRPTAQPISLGWWENPF